MHLYLNVLVNLIIKTYLNDSSCIIHYHDDGPNLVHIQRVPTITRRIWGKNNLLLDQHHKCRHFLLKCADARLAFESTEDVVRTNSWGFYNNRKYMIIVHSQEAFVDFFNSSLLTFVRDLLVIYAPKLGSGYDYEEDIISEFELFTHKYVGLDGNNDAVWLDSWFPGNLTFKVGNNLYPDKITDQQGRELRAYCAMLLPYAWCGSEPPIGNEYNIMVKYAERFNMTLNSYRDDILNTYYGIINFDWTGEGVIGRLILNDEDYCDIVYGGFPSFIHVDKVESVIYTYEVSVPLPNIKYGIFMFLEVFDHYVWIYMFLLYILTRGLIYFHSLAVKSKCPAKPTRSNITSLTLYGLLINQPVAFSSDIKQSKFLKYIMILMLVTSVLLVTAYNSRLASVMVTPIFENDINTLSELAASDLSLLFFDAYYTILSTDERKVYSTLFEKITLIPNNIDFELSEEMLSSRKYAVARYRRINGQYFESAEHLIQMYSKFKPITPELFIDHYFFLLRKNSMHTYQLQELVRTAEETGLMRYWEEAALRLKGDTLFQKQIQGYSRGNQNVILNLHHLKGIFAFWGFGMALSIIIFLIECLKGKNTIPLPRFYN